MDILYDNNIPCSCTLSTERNEELWKNEAISISSFTFLHEKGSKRESLGNGTSSKYTYTCIHLFEWSRLLALYLGIRNSIFRYIVQNTDTDTDVCYEL